MSSITRIHRELLSDNWYVLHKYSYDLERKNGQTVRQVREVYDRGDGATVLLYNRQQCTVLLIRQFRMPTYVNGNSDGMLLETCAGLLEGETPEVCVCREAQEETGYVIAHPQKVFTAYMSPGGVTEQIHCFIAEYSSEQRKTSGGGIDDEDIECVELPFATALQMVSEGQIRDGKTIMLLQHLQLSGVLASQNNSGSVID